VTVGCIAAKILAGSNAKKRPILKCAPMNDKSTVLVTGSDGSIGRHLVPYLAAQGYKVIAASRTASAFEVPNITAVQLPDLSTPFDWHPLLQQWMPSSILQESYTQLPTTTCMTASIIARPRHSLMPHFATAHI
jgi:NAD dependent epimerase/dehydratase family